MKFKTTIKLITEAKDKNEAMELAGEYLSGNLASGVDMRMRTAPLYSNIRRVGLAVVLSSIFLLSVLHLSYIKHTQGAIQSLPGESVIQPPLNTSSNLKSYSAFQKEWQARHTEEALNLIKK